MEAIEAIMTRRSVRQFAKHQIADAVLEKILKAGTYAPSALALQLWAFVIVQNQKFLDQRSSALEANLIGKIDADRTDKQRESI